MSDISEVGRKKNRKKEGKKKSCGEVKKREREKERAS